MVGSVRHSRAQYDPSLSFTPYETGHELDDVANEGASLLAKSGANCRLRGKVYLTLTIVGGVWVKLYVYRCKKGLNCTSKRREGVKFYNSGLEEVLRNRKSKC